MDDFDTLVFLFPLVTHLWTKVRRPVINQYHLHTLYMLTEHTLHTTVEGGFYAINGDDDT
jgi:hypothetical protein